MVWLILQFAGLAVVIVVAGTFLTRYADALGELTGMGRSLAGLVLLAAATSLPELAVDCNAARIPAPNLAVGDLMGSCLFNLLILAVLDMTYSPRGIMLSRTAAAHALSATMSVVLVGIALLAMLGQFRFEYLRMGMGSWAIAVTYLLGLRMVFFDQRYTAAAKPEQAEAVQEATEHISLRAAVTGYLAATAAIFAAAPFLAHTSDELARATGLGGTFVGTTLVAITTSLPEVVTTLAAVRMKAFDLAVGNILGSNSFNMFILVVVDVFYDGPLLASVEATHRVTAACVMLVTALAMMGLLYRAEKRYWIIEPDAVLVILAVLASLGLVYVM